MNRRSLPCAIYTRKSTEEGLDQDFNSLDAQRSACSAYIRSQEGEGWREVKAAYDDGGYSGGSLERPALQRLLADIAAGKVKVVVVYKVDRLTRSLADFAKIIETLEANGASFVSVTQQFSTTTSMGRLTLNVLLSFAQFEREVTAERIRDKIAASKKKGLWMGGVVPLGYDVVDRKLVVNEQEAATVRTLFKLYRQHANTRVVKEEADRLGLRSKRREGCTGKRQGGELFTRGHINKILTNRLYIGEITHKGASYPGEHEPIVKRDLWDAVQAQLAKNAAKRSNGANAKSPSLLTGLLQTSTGEHFSPSHASKKGQRYRYYVSKGRTVNGSDRTNTSDSDKRWRLPAPGLETIVIDGICTFLSDPQRISAQLAPNVTAADLEPLFARAAALATALRGAGSESQRKILLEIAQRVVIDTNRISIVLDDHKLCEQLEIGSDQSDGADGEIIIDVPVAFRRRGVETRLVIEAATAPAAPDEKLIALVVQAHRWFADIRGGTVASVHAIAKRDGVNASDVSRSLPIAFLAPDIVAAILDGRQPPELTASRLKRMRDLPLDWDWQRRYLGFA